MDFSCETKPIYPGIGFQGSGISQLTPDPRPLTPGALRPIVQNEPNCPKRGPEAVSGGPRYPSIALFHYSTISLFHHSSPKRVVRNKANSAEAAGRASTWWKTSYGELNMQGTSAKQSQFPHRPQWARAPKAAAGGDKRAKRSQFPPRADAMGLESATVCRPHPDQVIRYDG